ncbi:MAG: L-seryl-tRNA(Sec) selenium transferase, partial [Gemmatimonadetes bacterium]|nr:L-seryl-tRNA(Sec) selenium transferase [Gemmatimonadota bacterium]
AHRPTRQRPRRRVRSQCRQIRSQCRIRRQQRIGRPPMAASDVTDARRSIPSVERLMSSAPFVVLGTEWSRSLIVSTLQRELDVVRTGIASGGSPQHVDESEIARRVRTSIERLTAGSLVPVLNATGVILHTNLGRAPLADAAIDAIAAVARGYSTLEYDVSTGGRGSRYAHCRALLCQLSGAEDALVVNNNAAALVLALNTMARGLDAVVSRGELVEIGGAFRVPEIMARSGARLREVGSTNRTRIDDYRAALGSATGALLKVHPSNFAISGYTAETGVQALAQVARAAGVPLIHDIGSGLLLDPVSVGLPADEPTPQASLSEGADIVTMSGDKLLGGPQCGILLGSPELMERMRRNPMCRALRVDKLTLAALAATLRLYLGAEQARTEIPVLRMLTLAPAVIEERAARLAGQCTVAGVAARVVPGSSAVGGGAAAAAVLPTSLVLLEPPGGSSSDEFERRLRGSRPCVVTRIVDDRVAIDLRTIAPEHDASLLLAIAAAAAP